MERMKALVIEDNEVNMMMLSNMLKLYRIEVDIADTGDKALNIANTVFYDLIFVDYLLPDMNGIDLIKGLRQDSCLSKSSVIITLSANIDLTMRGELMDAGCDDIYLKPLHINQLDEIIAKSKHNLLRHCIRRIDPISSEDEEIIAFKKNFRNIPEIDMEIGMSYALGNKDKYLYLLELTVKQIEKILSEKNLRILEANQQILISHSLCNVLAYIGAINLAEEARILEDKIRAGRYITISFDEYLGRVKHLIDKLNSILEVERIRQRINLNEEPYIAIEKTEYEHILSQIIYYIKRYEYDSIVENIMKIILHTPPGSRSILYKALRIIENFEYEKALTIFKKMLIG